MPSVAEAVAGAAWYHTVELPEGVVTPGYYDLRRVAPKLPLPESLAGKRCLDVGTASGFWAFEMERRGADEVVAIDLDDPTSQDWQHADRPDRTTPEGHGYVRHGFDVAHSALGSRVDWRELSVYDVSAEELGGEFDFVFIGNLLLHLRDPVRALERLRSVTRGALLSFEPVLVWLSMLMPRRPTAALWKGDDVRWWTPNVVGHRRWVETAGFEVTDARAFQFQRFGGVWPRLSIPTRPLRTSIRFWLAERHTGVPSAWVLARPRVGATV